VISLDRGKKWRVLQLTGVEAAGSIEAGARRSIASGDGPVPKNCIVPSAVSASESALALMSISLMLSSSSSLSSSELPSASSETSSVCGSLERAPCT
jgi:hypothetical protein